MCLNRKAKTSDKTPEVFLFHSIVVTCMGKIKIKFYEKTILHNCITNPLLMRNG